MFLSIVGGRCKRKEQNMLPFFIIVNIFGCANSKYTIADLGWTSWPMQYDYDFFFDRIVTLTLNLPDKEKKPMVPGVLIDSNRVLTSYNAFKELTRSGDKGIKVIAAVLTGRLRHEGGTFTYFGDLYDIDCIRKIGYSPHGNISSDQWLSNDRSQSSLHDLIVLRINGNITNFSNLKPNQYTLKSFPGGRRTEKRPGPFMTDIASPQEKINKAMKFAFFDYRTESDHRYKVYSSDYEEDDDPLEDCEGWFDKNWGHFLCLKNYIEDYTLQSGAILISKDKLFGVGSFALYKGEDSALVFIDVRPFHELIKNACSNIVINKTQTVEDIDSL